MAKINYRSSQNNYQNNCLRIFFGSGSVTNYQSNSPEIFFGKVGNSVNVSRLRLSVKMHAECIPTSLVLVV